MRTLVIGVAATIVVIGFAISMWSFLSDSYDAYTGVTPASTTTYAPGTTKPPSTGTAIKVPAPDANPSDLPAPSTYDEATQWMNNNSVYSKTITVPTDCAVTPVNIQTASASALESHLNELTACLWRVWDPPLASAGYELPRPPVTVYTQPVTTACGKLDDVNAVYCGGDQRIYYAKPLYQIIPTSLRGSPFIADTIIAHEFGHTIQARTGILISETAWEQRSSTSSSKALEFSRRTEMQADCFAGMFTSSVASANHLSSADLKNLGTMIYNLGDDVLTGQPGYVDNHGSGAARRTWFTAGQKSTKMATCDTFTASSANVR